MAYRLVNIENRRFLGNKFKLLPFIRGVVDRECENIGSVLDVFSGSGSVCSAFTDKVIYTNDLLYSNYLCNFAWYGHTKYDQKKLIGLIKKYNTVDTIESNYMTENFADTYFSYVDCAKIGYIREDIEDLYHSKKLTKRERAILITSLIYGMDRIAKTCGHYDAYRKGVVFDTHLELGFPNVPVINNRENRCFNEDGNSLVRKLDCDLLFCDPPYNSRQYSDTYHLLENIARWEKPPVFGVAKKMDREALKSEYCTRNAAHAFEDLVQNTTARYIMLTYNNMAEKGNDRSNARMTDSDIYRILGAKGDVRVFTQQYKAFTTGKSDRDDNEERIFLCICGGVL